jgi:hypothetical protein
MVIIPNTIKNIYLVILLLILPDYYILAKAKIEIVKYKTIEIEEQTENFIEGIIWNLDFNKASSAFVLSIINGMRVMNLYNIDGKIIKSIKIDDNFTESNLNRILELTGRKNISKYIFIDSLKLKQSKDYLYNIYSNSTDYAIFANNDSSLIFNVNCNYFTTYLNKDSVENLIRASVLALINYNIISGDIETNIYYNSSYKINKTVVQSSHFYNLDSNFIIYVETDLLDSLITDSLYNTLVLFDKKGNWIKPIFKLPKAYYNSKLFSIFATDPKIFNFNNHMYVALPYSYKIYNLSNNEEISLSAIDSNSSKYLDSLIDGNISLKDVSENIYNNLQTSIIDINSLNDSMLVLTTMFLKNNNGKWESQLKIIFVDKKGRIIEEMILNKKQEIKYSKFVKNINSYAICYIKDEKWFIDLFKININ